MGKIALILVMSWVVAVPMCSVMGEIDLQGMVDKAKEVGITEETIENAAYSDEAQQALKDGTAQQALNDAKDVADESSSTWGAWVKNTVGNMGFGKEKSENAAPSPLVEGSEKPLDVEIDLSPAGVPEMAPASAPIEESPSPSPSSSFSSSILSPSPSSSFSSSISPSPSSSPSPSPSPSVEAPMPDQVAEGTPTGTPASAPS